jgi:hypothetical protein
MAAMKRYLILGLFAASAANQAASTGSSPLMAEVKQQQTGVPVLVKSAPPRHLSEQERAELRRQLRQFNVQYSKRS